MTRVVLFEPDEDVRFVAVGALTGAGYEVVAPSTIVEARSAVVADGVGAAIVEAGGIGEQEWEALSIARSRGIPVVVCTVHAGDPDVVERTRRADAVLLEKTGDPEELVRIADSAVRH